MREVQARCGVPALRCAYAGYDIAMTDFYDSFPLYCVDDQALGIVYTVRWISTLRHHNLCLTSPLVCG